MKLKHRSASPCWKMSLNPKMIMKLFLLMALFVFLSLLASSSKITDIVSMSHKIRSHVVDFIGDLVNKTETDMNQSVSYQRYFDVEVNKRYQQEEHVTQNASVDVMKETNTDYAGISVKLVGIDAADIKDPNETFKKVNLMDTRDIKSENVDIFGNVFGSTNKTRQSECHYCFKHNFKYLIQNEHICKPYTAGQRIYLIILITTTHKNIDARLALRKTWLTITKNNTANVRYAFLLGAIQNAVYSKLVEEENNQYHDIIKEDFVDSYQNLTYKTIMAYKWASTKCSNAENVMKTDDDMFVNVPNIVRLVNGVKKTMLQSSILGACSKKASPIRNNNSKWYASLESYPEKVYPGFCSGTGYVTSMNVARKVYDISPSVPYFHLEDVYVSLCINKLGYQLVATRGFNAGRPRINPCLYKGPILMTAHHLPPTVLMMLWRRECIPFVPMVNRVIRTGA